MDPEATRLHSSSTGDTMKWDAVKVYCLLYADGRVTDGDSATFTREDASGAAPGARIASFKPYYFCNVDLARWDDTSATVKLAGKEHTLREGESATETVPLDYAYATTTVKLVNYEAEQKRIEKAERERADAIDRAKEEPAPVKARRELIEELADATDEEWPQKISQAWAKRAEMGLEPGHMAKIAKICFLPRYGHVDIRQTERWAKAALEIRNQYCMVSDEAKADLAFCNDVMTRICYARGQADQGHHFFCQAVRQDNSDLPMCWEVEYKIRKDGQISGEDLDQLVKWKNYRALNTVLRICGPDSKEQMRQLDEDGQMGQVWSLCSQLIDIYDEAPCESKPYEATCNVVFLLYLKHGSLEFWDDPCSEQLKEGTGQGNEYCQYYMGRIMALDMLDQIHEDIAESLRLGAMGHFLDAADQGHIDACLRYADLLEQAEPENPRVARYRAYADRLINC